ncbi:hypothetical protein BHM03_00036168 [Ensete ventricosum]|nr:hypothetical protein BHM03_00036168 [Ensete ventricosum]
MASVDLIGAKLEAFETRMKDKLCTLFVEFRLGRSPSPRRSQRGESFDRKENPPEKEEQAIDSSYLRRVVRQLYTLSVVISFACIHEERLNNDAQRTKIMNRPATIKPSASPVANRTSQPKELPKNSEKDWRKGYVGTATNRGVEIIATKGGSFW